MNFLNWRLVFVSLLLICLCRGSLIIEEDQNSRAEQTGTGVDQTQRTERVRDFLQTYLRERPSKKLSNFFGLIDNCLEEDKEQIIFKPHHPRPHFECAGLKENCFASAPGFAKEYPNLNSSEKNFQIQVNDFDFEVVPRQPSGRCCAGTMCRSDKCCVPSVSTAESPPCFSDWDCCDTGVCDLTYNLCKTPAQGSCSNDSQCVNGPCTDGKCCITPLDSCHTCRDSNDCCGESSCSDGKCLSNNGYNCNSNSQCSSGLCCSNKICGLVTPTPKDLNPRDLIKCAKNSDCCSPGLCETKSGTCRYPDASACTDDSQCIHGECYGNTKCCFDTPYGDQCVNSTTYCCYSAAVCKTSTNTDGSTISICAYPP